MVINRDRGIIVSTKPENRHEIASHLMEFADEIAAAVRPDFPAPELFDLQESDEALKVKLFNSLLNFGFADAAKAASAGRWDRVESELMEMQRSQRGAFASYSKVYSEGPLCVDPSFIVQVSGNLSFGYRTVLQAAANRLFLSRTYTRAIELLLERNKPSIEPQASDPQPKWRYEIVAAKPAKPSTGLHSRPSEKTGQLSLFC